MGTMVVFHIQDQSGRPVVGALLSATSPTTGPWQGVTDCAGNFATPSDGVTTDGIAPGHYDITITAKGCIPNVLPADIGTRCGTINHAITRTFKPAPSREAICLGQTTQQGLTVTTAQFGAMPWWGGCWAWLTKEDRATAAAQLLAHGDTICVIQVALDGRALYDEPNQFYSPDKFGPLTQTLDQTVALVHEAIELGFDGVWLFLDGDNGNYGYPVAVQQTQALGPLLAELNTYVVQFPGWDGVFYGYDPVSKIQDFAAQARAAGAVYVGLEHSTGHIPLGEGTGDYSATGRMKDFDVVLGEFNDGQFDGTVWEILARMIGPAYIRPSNQPANDDPPPVPFYLAESSPRGPFYYRIFEYYIYGWVRNTPASVVQASRDYFASCGATNIC